MILKRRSAIIALEKPDRKKHFIKKGNENMQEIIYNPWHGCRKYSAGCLNCYVYRRDEAIGRDASAIKKTSSFQLPVLRKRSGEYKIPSGSRIYTCMTSDFFIEEADEWRSDIFDMIRTRSDCEFIIITKRILRFYDCIPDDWGKGYPNITIMCTIENQLECDRRMPFFITLPIAKKSVICEPLLSAVELSPYLTGGRISSVTVGGESGDNGRLCKFEWVTDIFRQCRDTGTGFHFKQTGTHFEKDGRVYTVPRYIQASQAEKAGLDN